MASEEPCRLKRPRADVRRAIDDEVQQGIAVSKGDLQSDAMTMAYHAWEGRVLRLLEYVWFTTPAEAATFRQCSRVVGSIAIAALYRLRSQVGELVALQSRLDTYEEAPGVGDAPPAATMACDLSSLHPMIVQRCGVAFENRLYDEAILNAFKLVEDEIRQKIDEAPQVLGVDLVSRAMSPKPSHSVRLIMSMIPAEQQAAHDLYRGAIGFLKNPQSHRFLDTTDPVRAFETLAFASFLMRKLDEATTTQ